jgi:hypothetical protein
VSGGRGRAAREGGRRLANTRAHAGLWLRVGVTALCRSAPRPPHPRPSPAPRRLLADPLLIPHILATITAYGTLYACMVRLARAPLLWRSSRKSHLAAGAACRVRPLAA